MTTNTTYKTWKWNFELELKLKLFEAPSGEESFKSCSKWHQYYTYKIKMKFWARAQAGVPKVWTEFIFRLVDAILRTNKAKRSKKCKKSWSWSEKHNCLVGTILKSFSNTGALYCCKSDLRFWREKRVLKLAVDRNAHTLRDWEATLKGACILKR